MHWLQGAGSTAMDAPSLFNRRALDKLVLQLTSSGMSASRVGATRSLSDVRLEAAAEASRNDSAAQQRQRSGSGRIAGTRAPRPRGSSSHQRPPRPREKRPKRIRPVATQQSVEAEAEASELTALLRCGNYSICVVRSDDLDNRSTVGEIDRAHADRRTRRPVSAPARDRILAAPTRQSRVTSWHGHVRSQSKARPSESQRTVSSVSAQSQAYENPPPASDDEFDFDSESRFDVDSDSLFADDELTDVPHSSSAPQLRTRLISPRWQHRDFEDTEEELNVTLSGSRNERPLTRSVLLSNDMPHQVLSGPCSSHPSSTASNRRRRSRSNSRDARKARSLRRWVATEDQENVQPQARENSSNNSSKTALGRRTAAPPRPPGPPPVRSSSAIRSRAAAETMLAMR